MSSNMPVLWQNCLLQYKTEIAKKAWVWFAETRGEGAQYAADNYANEVERLIIFLRPMIEMSEGMNDSDLIDDLMRFTLTRHANWRLGNNTKPDFLKDASL